MKVECIAYHEAGHATVALAENIRFRRATIIADAEAAGHVLHFCPPPDPNRMASGESPAVLIKLMKHARIALAGDVALRLFSPRSFRTYGGRGDRQTAVACAEKIVGGDQAILETQLKLFHLQTKAIVKHNWPTVIAIAQALLERRTITETEARQLHYDAMLQSAKTQTAHVQPMSTDDRRTGTRKIA